VLGQSAKRLIKNSIIIAILVGAGLSLSGLSLSLSGLSLPTPVYRTIDMLAVASVPCGPSRSVPPPVPSPRWVWV